MSVWPCHCNLALLLLFHHPPRSAQIAIALSAHPISACPSHRTLSPSSADCCSRSSVCLSVTMNLLYAGTLEWAFAHFLIQLPRFSTALTVLGRQRDQCRPAHALLPIRGRRCGGGVQRQQLAVGNAANAFTQRHAACSLNVYPTVDEQSRSSVEIQEAGRWLLQQGAH